MPGKHKAILTSVVAGLILVMHGPRAGTKESGSYADSGNIWVHDNLFPWAMVPFDQKKRGPEQRAQLLEKLGFKYFAYDWRDEHVPTFDAEIDALQKHGIHPLAWWFPLDADDPPARKILETLKRHGVHPQLWIIQSQRGVPVNAANLPKRPLEQKQRVIQEANRIEALVKLATPYGWQVAIYNHSGWLALPDNDVAVIERLERLGVKGVGIAYNFQHAREADHDDTVNFPAIWRKIKPHVVAVEATGTHAGPLIYPSQGATASSR